MDTTIMGYIGLGFGVPSFGNASLHIFGMVVRYKMSDLEEIGHGGIAILSVILQKDILQLAPKGIHENSGPSYSIGLGCRVGCYHCMTGSLFKNLASNLLLSSGPKPKPQT